MDVGVELADPNLFLHICSSWVKIRLHAENYIPMLSGSALKVSVCGGGKVGSTQLCGPTNFVLG